jgi:23S rRNA (adenine2030-N6)-methyltransferase
MNHHYGELGDVWKHLPLAEVLRLNPPRHYWETHAGSVSYPLTESATRRHGVFHFLQQAPDDPDLAPTAYLQTLQVNPGIYPGSPLYAMRALGDQASYLFCDIDPGSAATLRQATAGFDASIVEADGVAAVAAAAQRGTVKPEDVLVLIDPFFPNERLTPESMTSVELAASLAKSGYRLMFWYAYFELEERGWAQEALGKLAPGMVFWCGDTIMPLQCCYADRSGLFGCGIVLANATSAEIETCQRLGQALERIGAADQIKGNDPPQLFFQVMR